jgi:hypothetical protein
MTWSMFMLFATRAWISRRYFTDGYFARLSMSSAGTVAPPTNTAFTYRSFLCASTVTIQQITAPAAQAHANINSTSSRL